MVAAGSGEEGEIVEDSVEGAAEEEDLVGGAAAEGVI